jgi:tryptophan-rich sensory protein
MTGIQAWTPLIWLLIQIGLTFAALLIWQAGGRWPPVAAVIVLLLLIQLYPWLLCRSRRLGVGAVACLIGWIYSLILAAALGRLSAAAVLALLPYLLWSPLEAWVNWKMRLLNRGSAA